MSVWNFYYEQTNRQIEGNRDKHTQIETSRNITGQSMSDGEILNEKKW